MIHPLGLEPDDNGTLLVTCADIPEVTTFGEGKRTRFVPMTQSRRLWQPELHIGRIYRMTALLPSTDRTKSFRARPYKAGLIIYDCAATIA